MNNSVNTNVSAIVALQSLNRTNTQLESVQKRVSTGFRVNDAVDDGAAFAVAQGLRSDVKANEAVNERLSAAKGLVNVTGDALRSISDTLGQARAVLVKLADGNLSADERTRYGADLAALEAEVSNYVTQAEFNGTNLLSTAGPAAVNVIASIDGTNPIALARQDVETTLAGALGAVADAAAAVTRLSGTFATYENLIGSALATVGGYSRRIDNQAGFVNILNDATTSGVGAIVDADLAKESARLQAMQIRQQLGTQTLSIANQSPSILLRLFQ